MTCKETYFYDASFKIGNQLLQQPIADCIFYHNIKSNFDMYIRKLTL